MFYWWKSSNCIHYHALYSVNSSLRFPITVTKIIIIPTHRYPTMHPWVQRRRLPKCIDSGYPSEFDSTRKSTLRRGETAFPTWLGYKWVVVLSNRWCSARYVSRAARAPHWGCSTALSIRSTRDHRSEAPCVLHNVFLMYVLDLSTVFFN